MLSSTICIFSKKSFKTVLLENLIHGVYHLWSERGKRKCSNCKWKVLVAQLCLTLLQPHGLQPIRFLCPWDSPGKILEWVATAFSGALFEPGMEPGGSCITGQFFTVWASSKAHKNGNNINIFLILYWFSLRRWLADPCAWNAMKVIHRTLRTSCLHLAIHISFLSSYFASC